MPIQILMPQLGESVVEGTIGKWLKQEGEPVKEFEPVLEVTTDKVDTEVTAATDGVLLKIAIPDGTTVNVGTVLGWIGQPGEALPGANGGPVVYQPEPTPAPQLQTPAREAGFISPVVAKLIAEYQVDLGQVKGTGLGGRVTKKDVLAFVESRSAPPKPAEVTSAVQPANGHPAPTSTPAATLSPSPSTSLPGDTVVPLSPMRKSIAEHMLHSKQIAPHVTTVFEVDMSRVVAHRAAHQATFARDGVDLTFTAYFVAAAATALKAYPVVNSTFAEDKLILKREINIGVAVSLGEAGLIVPVIKQADEKSLLGLARALNDLAGRARSKQLKPEEVQGGTFTLTNHGVSGSLLATPIINQPQCGILGAGLIEKRVVVINDAIAIRPLCYLSLTFDHRSLDGATADHFVAQVKTTLESWPAA